jgi:hypothetical protein
MNKGNRVFYVRNCVITCKWRSRCMVSTSKMAAKTTCDREQVTLSLCFTVLKIVPRLCIMKQRTYEKLTCVLLSLFWVKS